MDEERKRFLEKIFERYVKKHGKIMGSVMFKRYMLKFFDCDYLGCVPHNDKITACYRIGGEVMKFEVTR